MIPTDSLIDGELIANRSGSLAAKLRCRVMRRRLATTSRHPVLLSPQPSTRVPPWSYLASMRSGCEIETFVSAAKCLE